MCVHVCDMCMQNMNIILISLGLRVIPDLFLLKLMSLLVVLVGQKEEMVEDDDPLPSVALLSTFFRLACRG